MNKFLQRASLEALNSKMACKHGAVLTQGHKILSSDYNNTDRTCFGKLVMYSCHAEHAAIIRSCVLRNSKSQSYERWHEKVG